MLLKGKIKACMFPLLIFINVSGCVFKKRKEMATCMVIYILHLPVFVHIKRFCEGRRWLSAQHSCPHAPSKGHCMLIGLTLSGLLYTPWPCIGSSGILEISKVSRTGRRGDPAIWVGGVTSNGLEDTGRGKGKLGQSERMAWTYIHYQM